MSYTEKHIGKLIEVDFDKNGTAPESFYKMLCDTEFLFGCCYLTL